MQTKSAKSMKPLYMLILSIIIIVAFFVISPTVAKAVDPPPEPEPVRRRKKRKRKPNRLKTAQRKSARSK